MASITMTGPDVYLPESLDDVAALRLAADGPARPVVAGTGVFAEASGSAGLTSIVVDVAIFRRHGWSEMSVEYGG